MRNKLRHIGIVVDNLSEAINFLSSLVMVDECKEATETGKFISALVGLKDITLKHAKLKINGTIIELLEYCGDHKDIPPAGSAHIAITVDDIDKIYSALKDKHICYSAPLVSPDEKVRVLYCQGPGRLVVEIVEEL